MLPTHFTIAFSLKSAHTFTSRQPRALGAMPSAGLDFSDDRQIQRSRGVDGIDAGKAEINHMYCSRKRSKQARVGSFISRFEIPLVRTF